MSYKTNPISNRIKINKGWKNPYLPTKTLNYSRDISLWFKVYLLLRVFLNLKKIQLVSCEIRFDQQNKKILFLRINKKGTRRKKRRKKKTVLNKILKKFKTPLLKHKNRGAIFFLYNQLIKLRNSSFWKKNKIQKKNLSKSWLTKPKISSWLTTLKKIIAIRKESTKKLNYLKKNKIFTPIQHLKVKFYTHKQKQILAILSRVKKRNLLLFLKLFTLTQQKNPNVLKIVIENLKKEIYNNKIQIDKLNTFYNFFLFSIKSSFIKKKQQNYLKQDRIFNSIERNKLNLFWKMLKKKFNSFSRTRFLRQELPMLLLYANKDLLKCISKQNWKFLKKETLLKQILHLNFLVAQIAKNNFLLKNHSLFLNWNIKSQVYKGTYKQMNSKKTILNIVEINSFLKSKFCKNKKNNIVKQKLSLKLYYNISLWLLLRKKKRRKKRIMKFRAAKRKIKFHNRVRFKEKAKTFKKYNHFLVSKKFALLTNKKPLVKHLIKTNKNFEEQTITTYYKYRTPYRKMYFGFIKLITNLKLKYLIQDFVQKYFSVLVETKIVHVLNAYKNKNYFRLVFPLKKKKKNKFIKKKRLNTWNQKQIFLASRIKLAITSKKTVKQKLVNKKNIKVLNKKELLILAEKKKINWHIKNYFSRIKRNKDFRYIFKYFIPTMIEFSRSLDPKLLADTIAKVVGKAKKQTWMINTIKNILQSIQLPKNVGYKIVLTGRINSKKKSRLIYITRKQITLQVFDNNMNFAYSQAKARIGTFGVKIWVYSKKIKKNEKNYNITSKY